MPTQVLGDLERLLVPTNMEILWGYPWLEWFWEFVVPHPTSASLSQPTSTSPSPSTEIRANVYDRTHGLVLFIAQKMMLYDILLTCRSRCCSHHSHYHRSRHPSLAIRVLLTLFLLLPLTNV